MNRHPLLKKKVREPSSNENLHQFGLAIFVGQNFPVAKIGHVIHPTSVVKIDISFSQLHFHEDISGCQLNDYEGCLNKQIVWQGAFVSCHPDTKICKHDDTL